VPDRKCLCCDFLFVSHYFKWLNLRLVRVSRWIFQSKLVGFYWMWLGLSHWSSWFVQPKLKVTVYLQYRLTVVLPRRFWASQAPPTRVRGFRGVHFWSGCRLGSNLWSTFESDRKWVHTIQYRRIHLRSTVKCYSKTTVQASTHTRFRDGYRITSQI